LKVKNELRCSIVIPAYEEGLAFLNVLYRIKNDLKIDFECIVVVDSDSDGSLEQVTKISSKDVRFQAIVNTFGKGPAGALKTGFKHSKGQTVVVLSADGSEDIAQISNMVSLVERGVAIVAASRFMQGGQMIGSPFVKGNLSKIAGKSLNLLKHLGTSDPTNNFKAYSKEFIDSVDIQSQHGFEIALELVVKCKKNRGYIAQVPTIWIERQEGISNFKVLSAIPRYLRWYIYAFLPFR
jgi:glycosyltransferase involved in cell wall biosynthesis